MRLTADHLTLLHHIAGEYLRTGTVPLIEADGPVADLRVQALPEPAGPEVPWQPTEIQFRAVFKDGNVAELIMRLLA